MDGPRQVGFEELTAEIRDFTHERDWEQFHAPKNLVLALVGEVGELAEIFQWLTPDEASRVTEQAASASRVREELADVLIYLIRLADVLGVDLLDACATKLLINRDRYPVKDSRGRAGKSEP